MKISEEMAIEYLGTDPRKRTGETLESLLLLYGARVLEKAAKVAETLPCRFHPLVECHDACAAAIRKMQLP